MGCYVFGYCNVKFKENKSKLKSTTFDYEMRSIIGRKPIINIQIAKLFSMTIVKIKHVTTAKKCLW